jgi:hypothetical protein
MYIVIARANGIDSTFPHISPRIITKDSKFALAEARKALEKDNYFLSDVLIFSLKEDEVYSSKDSQGTDESPCKTLVYNVWRIYSGQERSEIFYHDFKELSGG